MNINKFTQKSLQAVQDCEKIAMDYGNQEIEQEHLLYALLTQDDGLIPKILDGEDILFRQRILGGDQSDVIILLNLLIIELLAVSRQLVLLIDDKCSVEGAV